MINCKNCGAVVARRDETCSYCGTPNHAYIPISADQDALMAGAMGAWQNGNYGAAIKLYRQIINDDPELFLAYFYLAHCLNTTGQSGEAIAVMTQASQLRPGNASIYYNIALMQQARGQYSEAMTNLQKALKLTDTDPQLTDRQDFQRRVQKAIGQVG